MRSFARPLVVCVLVCVLVSVTATTNSYPYVHALSLHDALPFSVVGYAVAIGCADEYAVAAPGPRCRLAHAVAVMVAGHARRGRNEIEPVAAQIERHRGDARADQRVQIGDGDALQFDEDVVCRVRENGRGSCRERVCQYV